MMTKEQEVLRVADEMFQQSPDWVTFFREILGSGRGGPPGLSVSRAVEPIRAGPRVWRDPAAAGQASCPRRLLCQLARADAGDHRPAAQELARVAACRGSRAAYQHEQALHLEAVADGRRRPGAGRRLSGYGRAACLAEQGETTKGVRSGLVSRVLSPSCPVRGTTGDGHFSREPIARLLKQPTRKSITARTVRACLAALRRPARLLPVWPCSRWGLPSQAGHPACW